MKKLLFCSFLFLFFTAQSQTRTIKITGMALSLLENDSWTEWTNSTSMNGVVTLNFDDLFIKVTTEEMTSTFDIISFKEEVETGIEGQNVVIFKCVSRSGVDADLRIRKNDLIIVLDTLLIAYTTYPL